MRVASAIGQFPIENRNFFCQVFNTTDLSRCEIFDFVRSLCPALVSRETSFFTSKRPYANTILHRFVHVTRPIDRHAVGISRSEIVHARTDANNDVFETYGVYDVRRRVRSDYKTVKHRSKTAAIRFIRQAGWYKQ